MVATRFRLLGIRTRGIEKGITGAGFYPLLSVHEYSGRPPRGGCSLTGNSPLVYINLPFR